MYTIDYCIACGGSHLKKSPAIIMPFVADRIFGFEPVEIDETWGLKTVKNGVTYFPCNTVECKDCGMLFSDVRFSDLEMKKLYNNYRGKEYTELREKYESGYKERNAGLLVEDHSKEVEEFILKYCRKPETILDYGGDGGDKTPFQGAQIDILDIGEKDVVSGTNKVSYIHKKYDLVVCAHVLEHVSSPEEILKEIQLALRNDSYLYIELPFEELILNKENNKRHWHEHINFFTPAAIHTLLERCGYEPVLYDTPYIGNRYVYMILCKKKG